MPLWLSSERGGGVCGNQWVLLEHRTSTSVMNVGRIMCNLEFCINIESCRTSRGGEYTNAHRASTDVRLTPAWGYVKNPKFCWWQNPKSELLPIARKYMW